MSKEDSWNKINTMRCDVCGEIKETVWFIYIRTHYVRLWKKNESWYVSCDDFNIRGQFVSEGSSPEEVKKAKAKALHIILDALLLKIKRESDEMHETLNLLASEIAKVEQKD